MPASDPRRERIEAFNQARSGGVAMQTVAMQTTGRGYSLVSQRSGTPIARLKPTGEADKVQLLCCNGERCGASEPFAIAIMPRDAALDLVASNPPVWINA